MIDAFVGNFIVVPPWNAQHKGFFIQNKFQNFQANLGIDYFKENWTQVLVLVFKLNLRVKDQCCEKWADFFIPSETGWALSRDNKPHPRVPERPACQPHQQYVDASFANSFFINNLFEQHYQTFSSFSMHGQNFNIWCHSDLASCPTLRSHF